MLYNTGTYSGSLVGQLQLQKQAKKLMEKEVNLWLPDTAGGEGKIG